MPKKARKKSAKLNAAVMDRIVELYASGLRVPAIASIIGCHTNSAFKTLHRRGVAVKIGRPAGSVKVKQGEAA